VDTQRTPESDALYARALAYFGTAQWQEAIDTFSKLKAISSAYPEADHLLADALLKVELERTQRLSGSFAAPRRIGGPIVTVLLVLTGLIILGIGGWNMLNQPRQSAATPIAVSGALPTPAPTETPLPLPTATLEPSVVPTNVPTEGTLLVRLAEGEQLVRPADNLYIVLDASGSMLADVGDRRKIDIAHDALGTLVNGLPDSANVALRTYGRRRSGDCNDIELVQPSTPLDRAALNAQIRGIIPAIRSRTPMAASLNQIAEDLKNLSGDTLVLLVSDGDETCNGDPAQAAADLRAAFPTVRVSVIGFSLGPEEWNGRLKAIAENGAGRYFEANDGSQLVDALQLAVTPNYRLINSANETVTTAQLGNLTVVQAGSYTLEFDGQLLRLPDVVVSGGNQTLVELRNQAGALSATVSVGNVQP
jgi:hypothetical protein